MDAEGRPVRHRDRRVGRLAVVVAVQNVMVAACLAVTLSVFWGYQQRAAEGNAHIYLDTVSDITGNTTLSFGDAISSRMMSLVDKQWISVNCTGPYVLYMEVCCTSIYYEKVKAELQLRVQGMESHVSSFSLEAWHQVNCTWLRGLTYLMANRDASLHLVSSEGFKIKNMTLGLSYLLGGGCEF